MREEPPEAVKVRDMLKLLLPADDGTLPLGKPPPPTKTPFPQLTPGQPPKPPQLKPRKQGGWMPCPQAAAKAAPKPAAKPCVPNPVSQPRAKPPQPAAKPCVQNPVLQGHAKLPQPRNQVPVSDTDPVVQMSQAAAEARQGKDSKPEEVRSAEVVNSGVPLAAVPRVPLAAPGFKKRVPGGAFAVGTPTGPATARGPATQVAKKVVKKKAAAKGDMGPPLQAPTVSVMGEGPVPQQTGIGAVPGGDGGLSGLPFQDALHAQAGKVEAGEVSSMDLQLNGSSR
jgi:hypothetical protein